MRETKATTDVSLNNGEAVLLHCYMLGEISKTREKMRALGQQRAALNAGGYPPEFMEMATIGLSVRDCELVDTLTALEALDGKLQRAAERVA